MKREEPTKTLMMNSDWVELFCVDGLNNIFLISSIAKMPCYAICIASCLVYVDLG